MRRGGTDLADAGGGAGDEHDLPSEVLLPDEERPLAGTQSGR